MQKPLLDLGANIQEKLRAKRVTLRSAVVIPDKEPSHRLGKESVEQESRIKKFVGIREEDSESGGYQDS